MNVCQDASGERLYGRLCADALRRLVGVPAHHAGHRQPWVRGTVGIDLRLPACLNQVSRHADGIWPLRGDVQRQQDIVVFGVSGRAGPSDSCRHYLSPARFFRRNVHKAQSLCFGSFKAQRKAKTDVLCTPTGMFGRDRTVYCRSVCMTLPVCPRMLSTCNSPTHRCVSFADSVPAGGRGLFRVLVLKPQTLIPCTAAYHCRPSDCEDCDGAAVG